MFSKVKSSLNVARFVKKLNTESVLKNNGKLNLPLHLATVENGYKNRNRTESNSKEFNNRRFLNKALLISIFPIAYLERKYDLLSKINFLTDLCAVNAKVSEKELSDELSKSTKNLPDSKLDIRKSFNFIADAVESAIPSVVQILIYEKDPYFGSDIKVSSGSGFIFSKNKSYSLVLTNAHVVDGYSEVNVELSNGKKLTGKVECIDNFADLASIKVDETSLPALEFDFSKNIRVGEFVCAIGYPFGIGNSVTAGIISSLTRKGKDIGFSNDKMDYIQTDASINIGNSGGPLISLSGKVIGINTYKLSNIGINLAIPSYYAIQFLEEAQIISKKNQNLPKLNEKDKNRYLGVTMLSLTPDVLEKLPNLSHVKHGVLLVKIAPGSIAEKAGLKVGDIIIEINNRDVSLSSEIYKEIEESSKFNLLIIRADQKIRFNINFQN